MDNDENNPPFAKMCKTTARGKQKIHKAKDFKMDNLTEMLANLVPADTPTTYLINRREVMKEMENTLTSSEQPNTEPYHPIIQVDTCPFTGRRSMKTVALCELPDDAQQSLKMNIEKIGEDFKKMFDKEIKKMLEQEESENLDKENVDSREHNQNEPKQELSRDTTAQDPVQPELTPEEVDYYVDKLRPCSEQLEVANHTPQRNLSNAKCLNCAHLHRLYLSTQEKLRVSEIKTSYWMEQADGLEEEIEKLEEYNENIIRDHEQLSENFDKMKLAMERFRVANTYLGRGETCLHDQVRESRVAMKESEEKIRNLEEQLKLVKLSEENLAKELGRMKGKISKSTATMENSKGESKNLRVQIQKLKVVIESKNQELLHAQEEISQLDQKVEDVQLNLALNQSQMDKETEKNMGMIAELQHKVQELSLRSSPSTSSGASSPMTTIEEWLKFKDDFVEKRLVDEAKCETERLKDLTTDPKIKDLCVFELTQFEISSNIYIDVINLNISKLQKGYAPTELLSLPGLPILSKKFRLEYLKEMREQSKQAAAQAQAAAAAPQVVPDTGFDPKVECYICTRKFQRGDKVWTCNQCSVPTCIGCHLKWKKAQKESLNVNEACGYCRIILEEEQNKKKKR